MKIYTADFNANQPTLKQIGVPNYSDFKIGIDVEKNGEKIELGTDNVTLKDGDTTISADGEYNGYVTFPLSTGDCGDDKTYNVVCHKGFDSELSAQLVTYLQYPVPAGNVTKPLSVSIDDNSSLIGKSLDANKIYCAVVKSEQKATSADVIADFIEPSFDRYTKDINPSLYGKYFYKDNEVTAYLIYDGYYTQASGKHWSSSYTEDIPCDAPVVKAGGVFQFGT